MSLINLERIFLISLFILYHKVLAQQLPFCVGQSQLLCVGHRGYPDKFPENTLKSLQKALDYGSDALESDVRLTKDGQVIMMHDTTLDRTTNGTGFIDNKNWFGYIEYLRSDNEPIPLFQDVLNLLKKDENKDVFLIVDIKNDNRIKILDVIADIIHSNTPYDFTSQLYIGVWTSDFLERARKVLPEFPISYISDNVFITRKKIFDKVESYNMDYLSILSDRTGFVDLIKSKGRKLFVWTVDDTKDIERCIEFGKIDGILSDNPVECIRIRNDVIRRKNFLDNFYEGPRNLRF